MGAYGEDAVEDDLAGIDEEDRTPAAAEDAASQVLETAAQRLGIEVHRYDSDLVVCQTNGRRAAFRGFAGSTSGKVAHVLCRNDGWLRRHLDAHGLPTLDTRLTAANDPDAGYAAAERFGWPVGLRLATDDGPGREAVVPDAEAFQGTWRDLQESVRGVRAPQMIVERRPLHDVVELAVVGDQIVAVRNGNQQHQPELPESAADIALQAVGLLPGASYASVRMARGIDVTIPAVVISIDPTFASWIEPLHSRAPEIADAILKLELQVPTRVDVVSVDTKGVGVRSTGH